MHRDFRARGLRLLRGRIPPVVMTWSQTHLRIRGLRRRTWRLVVRGDGQRRLVPRTRTGSRRGMGLGSFMEVGTVGRMGMGGCLGMGGRRR